MLKEAFPRIFVLALDNIGIISELGQRQRRETFDWEKSQCNCFLKYLDCVIIRKSIRDTIAWSHSSSGLFSVSSFHKAVEELRGK